MRILRNNRVFLLFLLLAFLSFVSADFSTHNFILGNENVGPLKAGIIGQIEATGPSPTEPKLPLLLARNQTRRPDILRMFKIYEGGWNISSNHYWASVGFTGAAGFIISVLWFHCFGTALILNLFFGWRINFRGKNSARSHKIYLTLQTLIFCATLVGSAILFVAPDKFCNERSLALDYIVNQSDFTAQMLRNVTGYLTFAEAVDVPQFKLPQSALKGIYELRNHTSIGADTLTTKTKENLSKASEVFDPILIALIFLWMLVLCLFAAILVLCILEPQYAADMIIVCDWFFVTASIFLLGYFMIANSAISDLCVATQEWVDNPQVGTAMSSILPCVDDRTSRQTLSESREVVRLLVNTVNTFIHTSANSERPPAQFYYNQSGPLMPILCFPFDYNKQDRECSPQEVSLMNASLVWKKYKCMPSLDQEKCSTKGRLTPGMYNQLAQAANASYGLLHYTPTMLDLENCNVLRETVMTFNSRFCAPLKKYLLDSGVGFGLLTTAKMLNLVLWLVYSNRCLYEVFKKRHGNFAKVVPGVEK